jgi:hypothetical protein
LDFASIVKEALEAGRNAAAPIIAADAIYEKANPNKSVWLGSASVLLKTGTTGNTETRQFRNWIKKNLNPENSSSEWFLPGDVVHSQSLAAWRAAAHAVVAVLEKYGVLANVKEYD